MTGDSAPEAGTYGELLERYEAATARTVAAEERADKAEAQRDAILHSQNPELLARAEAAEKLKAMATLLPSNEEGE